MKVLDLTNVERSDIKYKLSRIFKKLILIIKIKRKLYQI